MNRMSLTSALMFLASGAWGIAHPEIMGAVVPMGFAAGLFTGRVVEARETRAGRGLIPPADQADDMAQTRGVS